MTVTKLFRQARQTVIQAKLKNKDLCLRGLFTVLLRQAIPYATQWVSAS